MEGAERRQWQGRTDGTPFMHKALIALCRVFPLWLLYFFMAFSVPVYAVANGKAFRAIYGYFRSRLGYGRVHAFLSTFANHFSFGMVVVDKFAAYAGKKFKTEIVGREAVEERLAAEGSFILLSAHIGNGEMAGFTIDSPRPVYSLLFGGESAVMQEGRRAVFAAHNMQMVLASEDMSHIFTLNNALDEGSVVIIYADRVFGSSKSVACSFLGAEARFPQGPFALAAMRETPVLSFFVMKSGLRRYRVYVDKVEVGRAGAGRSRATAVADMAQGFASRMEAALRRHPMQWFNFYDFWRP